MDKTELLSVLFIAAVLSALIVLTVYMVTLFLRRKASIDPYIRYSEKGYMELEYMREKVERQLYEVSKRLEASESRWNDVNHLVLSSQGRSPDISKGLSESVKLNDFLIENGLIESDLEIDRQLVFYLTPFSKEFSGDFESVYSVCRNFALKCLRGDEEFISGDVFPYILKSIVKARIVVANISGRNPNVFYELGIAHALNKPTIIISRNLSDATFDVRTKQVVLFQNKKELEDKLSLALARNFARK